ncbi:MAG: NADH:ubiquinone reductase (Na(+)-transporting) subunit B [Deltaproteobacteria bacterium]|nr:NADH:ubiquinone reductase (Na(+)-transporting) subunit B [Deltaproteobacteria bacterium]
MGLLRSFLDHTERLTAKGARFERLYPVHESMATLFYSSARRTAGGPHVRDAADLKRVMITVFVALLPCAAMAMYNTGLQANIALEVGAVGPDGWRAWLLEVVGAGGYDHDSVFDCVAHGAVYYLPVLIVTFVVGLLWEVLFAVVRRHEVNEGFFVTGMLFPLILPATIPLWQVALGISFGVVIGKELFGGTGYNVFNPALVARAFLFFGYPAQISGDQVWIAADGTSGATLLAQAQEAGMTPLAEGSMWWDAFIGTIPGSMGETSTLAILFGALVLIVTGVGSWRIMFAVALGGIGGASLLNWVGSDLNPMFAVPFWWHFVMGGMAFAAVFMATDPVTAPFTRVGQWIYGFLIGILIIVVRVLNPAYPDGLLVAILLMNVFAPLIDHYVVRAHIRKRGARYAD